MPHQHTAIKVLYLTPQAGGGTAIAAQSFIEEEIRAIAEWGVIPYVLTSETPERTTRDGIHMVGARHDRSATSILASAGFALSHSPSVATVLVAARHPREVAHAIRLEQRAAALVRRENIDVVHSHFGWPGGFGGSLAAAEAGVPLVASIRGMDVLVRPEIEYGLRLDAAYDAALRHLLRTATILLTATAFMRRTTIALGADPEKVHVLEKGVDAVRFMAPVDRGPAKAALGLTGTVLLAVGGLKARKGFGTILQALASLRRGDVTLAICGEGEERASLEQQVRSLGLSSQVRFDGHVSRERIPLYFSAADIFLHAAALEAAGNVVLEALSSGCAVVCTDSGGPSEYVQDGVNGFVVPVGDAHAIASRIDMLLRDGALRHRLSSEGRRRIEQRHTYPRMMAELRRIYDGFRVKAEDTGA